MSDFPERGAPREILFLSTPLNNSMLTMYQTEYTLKEHLERYLLKRSFLLLARNDSYRWGHQSRPGIYPLALEINKWINFTLTRGSRLLTSWCLWKQALNPSL